VDDDDKSDIDDDEEAVGGDAAAARDDADKGQSKSVKMVAQGKGVWRSCAKTSEIRPQAEYWIELVDIEGLFRDCEAGGSGSYTQTWAFNGSADILPTLKQPSVCLSLWKDWGARRNG